MVLKFDLEGMRNALNMANNMLYGLESQLKDVEVPTSSPYGEVAYHLDEAVGALGTVIEELDKALTAAP